MICQTFSCSNCLQWFGFVSADPQSRSCLFESSGPKTLQLLYESFTTNTGYGTTFLPCYHGENTRPSINQSNSGPWRTSVAEGTASSWLSIGFCRMRCPVETTVTSAFAVRSVSSRFAQSSYARSRSTFPCSMVFGRVSCWQTWPNHNCLRHLKVGNKIYFGPARRCKHCRMQSFVLRSIGILYVKQFRCGTFSFLFSRHFDYYYYSIKWDDVRQSLLRLLIWWWYAFVGHNPYTDHKVK